MEESMFKNYINHSAKRMYITQKLPLAPEYSTRPIYVNQ